jgi:hypothetical protein
MEPLFIPPRGIIDVSTKPPHEQNIHAGGYRKHHGRMVAMLRHHVENVDDASVPIQMRFLVFMGENQDVWPSQRVDSVLLAP